MRPTDDRKGNFIGLRINDETKADIQRLANEQGITFSECVRNIIVKHNYNSVKQNNDNVKQKDSNVKQNENYVKQLEQENNRLKELFNTLGTRVTPDADEDFKNEVYTGLMIVPVGHDKALKDEIEQLKTNLEFVLSDTSCRSEVESMAEMTCGVETFYKSVLEKIKNGEMDFNENGFDLTDTDVVEALKNTEVRQRIDDLRRGCDEKQENKTKAMTRALRVGLDKVRNEIWGIRG